ncbi:MAG: flagellar type III secretion system pore protein FliP [Planctomycetes bacterium]|nr:flagellar type III secretion system pore protein FliP [Planctomycetota bacterium]
MTGSPTSRFLTLLVWLTALLALQLGTASRAFAQSGTKKSIPAIPEIPEMPERNLGSPQYGPPAPGSGPGVQVNVQTGDSRTTLSTGIEIALFITLLTMAPAIVMSLTSFTRIIIVLSFMKRALSIQEMPPNLVVTGFAFFLTLFIMKPTLDKLYVEAWVPYDQNKITIQQAGEIAGDVLGDFLARQTRPDDLQLMYDIAKQPYPESLEDPPFHLLVPAFVLSEIKTAFQMGFVLFLPFLVIDLVISSVLISMGMFTLPPVVLSTPFKVLLFVLVDGWNLVIRSAVQSYAA